MSSKQLNISSYHQIHLIKHILGFVPYIYANNLFVPRHYGSSGLSIQDKSIPFNLVQFASNENSQNDEFRLIDPAHIRSIQDKPISSSISSLLNPEIIIKEYNIGIDGQKHYKNAISSKRHFIFLDKGKILSGFIYPKGIKSCQLLQDTQYHQHLTQH